MPIFDLVNINPIFNLMSSNYYYYLYPVLTLLFCFSSRPVCPLYLSFSQGGHSSKRKCRCSRKGHHHPLNTRGLLRCLLHDPGNHGERSQWDQDVSLQCNTHNYEERAITWPDPGVLMQGGYNICTTVIFHFDTTAHLLLSLCRLYCCLPLHTYTYEVKTLSPSITYRFVDL